MCYSCIAGKGAMDLCSSITHLLVKGDGNYSPVGSLLKLILMINSMMHTQHAPSSTINGENAARNSKS
jgi:hypothetical protein